MANIVVTWDSNSKNQAGFRVYRSIDGVAESALADVAKDLLSFTDSNVIPGTYVYSVSAFNAAGESTHTVLSNAVVVVGAETIPAAPGNVVATLS